MNEDKSTRPLEFAEKMDDWKFRQIAQIAQRTYFFESVIFMNLFFWVWFFLVLIFLGIPENAWAEPPCHAHVRVHSLGYRAIKSVMLPSDGKIIMCTKKPVVHFSQNCTCAKRNSQWASTCQRNLRCYHSMAARCLEYNGRHIQNKSKQYKCWKFWQDDKMYCVMKGLQNFKHTCYTFYDQQQVQDWDSAIILQFEVLHLLGNTENALVKYWRKSFSMHSGIGAYSKESTWPKWT